MAPAASALTTLIRGQKIFKPNKTFFLRDLKKKIKTRIERDVLTMKVGIIFVAKVNFKKTFSLYLWQFQDQMFIIFTLDTNEHSPLSMKAILPSTSSWLLNN